MKIKIYFTAFFIILCVSFFFVYSIFLPIHIPSPKIVVIPADATGKEVIKILKSSNLIREEFGPKVYLKITGLGKRLQAGEYEFNSYISATEIIKKIHLGKVREYSVTIPEGLTTKEIAGILADSGLIDKERFLKSAQSEEGYLFPDTYKFYKNIGEEEIIRLMKKRLNNVVNQIDNDKNREITLTLKEGLILASIVEKEAKIDSERNLIASVFLNRLKRRIRLESCATVLYALGKHKDNLDFKDLKVKSPFNTYLHYGLPPAPICNPGKASIKAVFNPVKTDFLYFVSKLDGTHEFSRTLKEHIRAKEKYREFQKD